MTIKYISLEYFRYNNTAGRRGPIRRYRGRNFLVRVSERIWGYAISYKGPDRYKHFLIDTSDDSYQFFGTNQIAHGKLADLVSFHEVRTPANVPSPQ